MAPVNIVVLGGGVGGTLVANLMARKLTRKEANITLIDRTGRHVYQPGWLYVPFGGDPPEKLEREGRYIQMAEGATIPFDFLVIGTGARLAPETLPGYAEAAQHFYSAEAALRLHAALREFQGGKVLIGVADIPYKCPPAPLEFTFMLDDYLIKRGIRENTEITYLSPLGRVFTIESVAQFVTPLLEERQINYELFFNTESIDPAARQITSLEGTTLDYDLLVLIPPHRGSDLVIESGLGDSQGWIATDRETLQSKADPTIYAIGDATDLPVSKSGAAAHFEARVIADRIVAAVRDEECNSRYDGQVMCFLETGRNQATQLIFNYNHPPEPPKPSAYYHYEKALLNRAYWHLVPTGLV